MNVMTKERAVESSDREHRCFQDNSDGWDYRTTVEEVVIRAK